MRDAVKHAARGGMCWETPSEKLVQKFRASLNFRDLIVCELIFFAQLPNRRVAPLAGVSEAQVAVLKHRFVQRLARSVSSGLESQVVEDPDTLDQLLTEVWEHQRPSCPKRTTIGRYMLETLDDDWRDYVEFHLNTLGCEPCLANLADLQSESSAAAGGSVSQPHSGIDRRGFCADERRRNDDRDGLTLDALRVAHRVAAPTHPESARRTPGRVSGMAV